MSTLKFRISKTQRAGLLFSVPRMKKHFVYEYNKYNLNCIFNDECYIYFAGALEYMTAEFCELSGNISYNNKRKNIKPSDINKAIKLHKEFDKLIDITTRQHDINDKLQFIYDTYLYRILKQVHPDMGLTSSAKKYINKLLNMFVKKIAYNTHLLVSIKKTKIIDCMTIQSAIKLCFPNELATHSISEGLKAVAKYKSSQIKLIK